MYICMYARMYVCFYTFMYSIRELYYGSFIKNIISDLNFMIFFAKANIYKNIYIRTCQNPLDSSQGL